MRHSLGMNDLRIDPGIAIQHNHFVVQANGLFAGNQEQGLVGQLHQAQLGAFGQGMPLRENGGERFAEERLRCQVNGIDGRPQEAYVDILVSQPAVLQGREDLLVLDLDLGESFDMFDPDVVDVVGHGHGDADSHRAGLALVAAAYPFGDLGGLTNQGAALTPEQFAAVGQPHLFAVPQEQLDAEIGLQLLDFPA